MKNVADSSFAEDKVLVKLILAAFLTLHAVMFTYDLRHPEVFFNTDRSRGRVASIQGLYDAWGSGDIAAYLARHGVIGDYLPQALIMALAGKNGLIIVQILLALVAGYAVFQLGYFLSGTYKVAAWACIIYLIFPHTLLFPHQLATEGLYSPLVAISLWLSARFLINPRFGLLVGSALLLGLANLIRPITLLWPILIALFLVRARGTRIGLAYCVVAMLPVMIWMSFVGLQTGTFGTGESDHDLGHNLYQRVWRITQTFPDPEVAKVRQTYLNQGDVAEAGSLGVMEYLRFGLDYPMAFMKHTGRDVIIFVGKSGVERFPISYFEINQGQRKQLEDSASGWRARMEKEGTLSALHFLWKSQGVVLAISLAGAFVMILFMVAAAIGGWHLLSNLSALSPLQRYVAISLVCFPLYILIFTQVVDAMQSRHRAPAEFSLVLLAVIGGTRGAALLSEKREH